MVKQIESERQILGVMAPVASAREAGLRYFGDDSPGIRRVAASGKFRYVSPDGRVVRDDAVLRRIRSLVIPPAWTDVWICPRKNGHLQATGRDAKGRKQYRYHPRWRGVRDGVKYERMIAFVRALPRIRRRVARDMVRRHFGREKVLATVVRLLELTLIRVGNEEYAKSNHSFGLSTMRDRHVAVAGASIHFRFRGKAGKRHSIRVAERKLARVIDRLQDLPGQRLFQYELSDGTRHDVESGDVNAIYEKSAGRILRRRIFARGRAPCWRRWLCTRCGSSTAKRNIVSAVERAATQLGNTPAICRKCYVHPGIFESHLDGSLVKILRKRTGARIRDRVGALRPEEVAVLGLLRQRLAPAGGQPIRS